MRKIEQKKKKEKKVGWWKVRTSQLFYGYIKTFILTKEYFLAINKRTNFSSRFSRIESTMEKKV